MPCLSIFFGAILSETAGSRHGTVVDSNSTSTVAEPNAASTGDSSTLTLFLFISVGMFFSGFVNNICFNIGADRQVFAFRESYLRNVLFLDMRHYDGLDIYGVPTSMGQHTNALKVASGQQLGTFIASVCQFFAGLIIAMVTSWEMALVLMAVLPILACAIGGFLASINAFTTSQYAHHKRAGEVLTQALMNLKTVVSLNAQARECEKHLIFREFARRDDIKMNQSFSRMLGLLMAGIYTMQGFSMFYGGSLIFNGQINSKTGKPFTGADVITVYWALVMGVFGLMGISPWFSAYGKLKPAMETYFKMALKNQRKTGDNEYSRIEQSDGNDVGLGVPQEKEGAPFVRFHGVSFQYPSRSTKQVGQTPDGVEKTQGDGDVLSATKEEKTNDLRPVLDDLSLDIYPGQKIALVGQSGSGKSTVAQLLERFYDVSSGTIEINGVELKSLSVNKFRKITSFVTQEPVLFGGLTLRENIILGLAKKLATEENIIRACKQSLIWDVIEGLPDGLNTMPGTGGLGLSGGQKQRIAIARALMRNPKLLILDEATSALDYASEKLVQETLDNLIHNARDKAKLTIVTIAHRLSTVQNADKIYVLKEGQILEHGTHADLYAKEGEYYNLVKLQEAKGLDGHAVEIADEQEGIEQANVSSNSNKSSSKDPQQVSSPSLSSSLSEQTTTSTWEETRKKMEMQRKREKEKLEEFKNKKLIWRLFYLNSPFERMLYIPAWIGSVLQGCMQPLSALLVTLSMGAFYEPDKANMKRQVDLIGMSYIGLAVVGYVLNVITQRLYAYSGSFITMRLQCLCAESLLGQECGWFEESPLQAPGAVLSLLTERAWQVSTLTGQQLATNINAISGIVSGLLLGFIFAWKLALAMCLFVPLFMLALYQGAKVNSSNSWLKDGDEQLAAAGSLVAEGITNLRTIRSLGCEAANEFCFLYHSSMQRILNRDFKKAIRQATINGCFQAMSFGFYIVGFGFGYYFMATDGLKFTNMFVCVLCITSGAQAASSSGGWLPDVAKGQVAAAEMFEIIDRTPKIRIADFKIAGFPAVSSRNHQLSQDEQAKLSKYGVSVEYAEAKRAQQARDRDLSLKWNKREKEKKKIKKEAEAKAKALKKSGISAEKGHQEDEENEDRYLAKLVKKEILECIDLPLLFYRERAHLLRSKWLDWKRLHSKPTEARILSIQTDNSFCLTSEWIITQIEFLGVSFNYPSRPTVPVLENLSFVIQRGQSVGLVGPSGGGKSTVFQLLQRLYDPESGAIYITFQNSSGVTVKKNLKEIDQLCEYRSRIGYVGQEPVLFNLSCLENVMYGLGADMRKQLSNEDIQNIADLCNIDFVEPLFKAADTETTARISDVVMDKLEWTDDLLGAKAQKVSGGQKQRLAIMRALLRQPELLMLDEATSALDSRSEKEVQTAIDKATQSSRDTQTTITIAHRLSTIQDCDLILVISEGAVVEQGNHETLMAKGDASGLYCRLVEHAKRN